jgi:hypothetical protein
MSAILRKSVRLLCQETVKTSFVNPYDIDYIMAIMLQNIFSIFCLFGFTVGFVDKKPNCTN